MKSVAILGSTGSIGSQAVEVAVLLADSINVEALTANSNGRLLAEQAELLKPGRVALSDPESASEFEGAFREMGIEFYGGPDSIEELLQGGAYDLVLNSIVGFAGLAPTLKVLGQGIPLALANKESLVAGGRLVMESSRKNNAPVIPVDSEHSAIFQCLKGEDISKLRRIILTASGGPFRDNPNDELAKVTVKAALAHPTWSMGRKVTVDSATLMNKGLEVLEAHHLFGAGLDDVEVIIHPQSVIHSMVEMVDGSVLAHLGVPDMRIPVQYAFTHPDRAPNPARFLSLSEYGNLSFEEVDDHRFPCVALAYRAGRLGGTYTAALNAANEDAVSAFLSERIGFMDIPAVVERVLERHEGLDGDTLEEIVEADGEARGLALKAISDIEGRR
ncbi:MAG: 1-deoxy-D-xylulose-5-phosphate reductoisomerase [Actinobacteria bacterium]|nr:1-deoxy-D-xylulose-5-phosphate reductoisomerase [Actinomycetota bacterium]